ncbi:cyclin 1 [Trypanosoma theileri]|uniref:Cyclin 1 n=1 Tax=Trypanosoma theileri TaxID=67003 RepID=A0A1X0NMP2_9TRYP|nr:cyclin 1 [Trypanosoma theileri]ORC85995.1 cyclin 1 [Trypanosoma theileri]
MITQIDTSSVKGVFAGSGLGCFGESSTVDRVLMLTGHFDEKKQQLTAPVRVAYIGTAVYDIPSYKEKQTKWFLTRGCTVGEVRVADPSRPNTIDPTQLQFLRDAHIIFVSGGNTLFAIRRWEETGLDLCLRAVVLRGSAVLAGGSAGAICWFTAGHSDSADPSTYAEPMLRAAVSSLENTKTTTKGKEENVSETTESSSWDYIRVHGLGLLPGMICPHYDTRESNGILRSEDFDKMMKRHPTERGIAIDHWAALVLQGDGTYEVFSVPGKTRVNDNTSIPAVYIKDVVNGQLSTEVLPVKGPISTVLRSPTGPIVRDPFEAYYAMGNPTATTEKLLRPPN